MPDIPYEVFIKELKKIPNWNKKSTHLSSEEEKFIKEANKLGATISSIAKTIKRDRATVRKYLDSM